MEILHETLIETALYLGYSMGERGEKMLVDSREVLEAVCERVAEFEARWAAAEMVGGIEADYMTSVERFSEELVDSLRAEGMIGRC